MPASSGLERPKSGLLHLTPALIGLLVSFLIPFAWVVRIAFDEIGPSYEVLGRLSLQTYRDAFTSPLIWSALSDTVILGVVVAALTTVISYPVALFLARTTTRWKGLLIALAIAPLLTSSIARTFGWIAILSDNGILNSALMAVGLISQPLQLSDNYLGIVIALIEIMMPYAILVMLSGFGRVDESLEEAARSLGASRSQAFWKITFPLSAPGVLAAALLVFVLSISSFVTPQLMGGGRVFLLATEIYNEATQTLNWPLAAAMSTMLVMIFALFIIVQRRLLSVVNK
ncbi:polyamine ABC transporter permease [Mycobacterium dioxanotrophicus]|uniref:Polyamine ABC transporter permease n=1 Tax=Mycobacterium dioxanotrophicus TaxID=482462 RepID=A0A1Y0BWK4_9MYCO|nr:polyamine ABC transporter permease [Mycobacterium dioxanotrophicus]